MWRSRSWGGESVLRELKLEFVLESELELELDWELQLEFKLEQERDPELEKRVWPQEPERELVLARARELTRDRMLVAALEREELEGQIWLQGRGHKIRELRELCREQERELVLERVLYGGSELALELERELERMREWDPQSARRRLKRLVCVQKVQKLGWEMELHQDWVREWLRVRVRGLVLDGAHVIAQMPLVLRWELGALHDVPITSYRQADYVSHISIWSDIFCRYSSGGLQSLVWLPSIWWNKTNLK